MSNKPINNGGSGFPLCTDFSRVYEGMTLRDYFAAAALQGWLASFGPETPHPVESKTSHILAAVCYQQADAMLAQRTIKEAQP